MLSKVVLIFGASNVMSALVTLDAPRMSTIFDGKFVTLNRKEELG